MMRLAFALHVLALLLFWAVRVRFTGWYSRAVPSTASVRIALGDL